MLSFPPAVRAALLGLVAVTGAALVGAMLHLGAVRAEAERALGQELGARAETLAAALAPRADNARQLREVLQTLAVPGEIAVVDGAGRVAAATDPDLAARIDWTQLDGAAQTATVGAEAFAAAAHPLGRWRVVALAPQAELSAGTAAATLGWALGLWGLVIGVVGVAARRAYASTSAQLASLGEQVAQGDADGSATIRRASVHLGPLAHAFGPISAALRSRAAREAEMREHIAALYHINPHYVVLCSFGGTVVEANPAFYAAAGLPIRAVRGQRFEALRETFPIEPLMEMAARSLRERSVISGLEYGFIGPDGETRAVEVSLRSFMLGGRRMVLIQATDVAHAKQLQRRVSAFTDTLDLLVNQAH